MTIRPALWLAGACAAGVLSVALVALHAASDDHSPIAVQAVVEPLTVLANAAWGGRVAEVYVRPGEAVRKGQILVRFNALELEQRLSELNRALRSVNLALEAGDVLAETPHRLRELVFDSNPEVVAAETAYVRALEAYQNASAGERQAASESLDNIGEERTRVRRRIGQVLGRGSAKPELIALAAAIRKNLFTAKEALKQAVVPAPCDARIDIFEVRPGDAVPPGAPIALLAVPGEYFADFPIPASEIGRVSAGMTLKAGLLDARQTISWRLESIAARKVPVPFRANREIAAETVVHARLSSTIPLPLSSVAEFQLP